MKHLLAIALALLCTAALATNKPAPAPGSTAAASAQAGATATTGGGDTTLYVLPGPIGGGPLPAGVCQTSSYRHVSVVFGAFSQANGDSHTDMECLKLLAELERLRATPVPRPAVEILTTAPPIPVCTPLARKTKLGAGCTK